MGAFAITVLALALAGALASWVVGAVYYARSVRTVLSNPGSPLPWLSVVVWPFATKRIANTASADASTVNKALVALIVCLTLGVTTISLSTNFNRVAK